MRLSCSTYLGLQLGVTVTMLAACGNGPDDLPAQIPDCNVSNCMPGTSRPTLFSGTPLLDAGTHIVDAGVATSVSDGALESSDIPAAGPGPGISPITGSVANPSDLGPVCPATQPADGAPCDSFFNSVPCNYARVSCFCVVAWSCQ